MKRIITLHGVTAPIETWAAFGLRFYSDTDAICESTMDIPARAIAARIPRLIMVARDELGDRDDAVILNRVASLVERGQHQGELAQAMNRLASTLNSSPTVSHKVQGLDELGKQLASVAQSLAPKAEAEAE